MRIVLMGSGSLACPALERLRARAADTLAAVVAAPDRPRGRRLEPAACPAKAAAVRAGIPVLTPERAADPAFVAAVAALAPDVLVVAAYGQFLRRALLDVPRLATVNVHPSLLPRYRGAAPIQWAIANGDRVTGVTILHVSERMDAGDAILQEEAPIRDDDTAATLEARLAAQGAALLDRALDLLAAGTAPRVPQDESRVVLAPKLSKADGRIDWVRAAAETANRVRGFHPWPGSYCEWPAGSGRTVRVLEARAESAPAAAPPGVVIAAGADGILVATAAGALRLVAVQPEGRQAMPAAAFCCGYRAGPGDRFG